MNLKRAGHLARDGLILWPVKTLRSRWRTSRTDRQKSSRGEAARNGSHGRKEGCPEEEKAHEGIGRTGCLNVVNTQRTREGMKALKWSRRELVRKRKGARQ